MKRCCFLVSAAVGIAVVAGVLLECTKGEVFSESILLDAFEKGRSLVIAKIDSVRKEEDTGFYIYRVDIVRSAVPGDLTEDDTYGPLELFAGASYGDALTSDSAYALFVTKDCPFYYSWAHRDDVLQVDVSDERHMQKLLRVANAAYEKTAIRRFRQGRIDSGAKLPPLPENIASLCEQFRRNPVKRVEIGKRLYGSDLGSRYDNSRPTSSSISYLPPKIRLTRSQVVALLGRPNLQSGWTYSWLCGQIDSGADAEEVGVLSAWFDKSEVVVRVLYQKQEKARWMKLRPSEVQSPY